ncbi:hypothetical protein T265_11796 [Opisthorchis viverrini]|uniref:Uncharacterized protein n=1 Tax=Opisthorchis viverrini TaxID=6198 RepID=A0A074Z866_OPIVI|nr:hypothetical protein T265_11796 [Opisthorchis viverrini]KER19430.1 hypothetical protein T265_11796 [Opisthorchis viverrini]
MRLANKRRKRERNQQRQSKNLTTLVLRNTKQAFRYKTFYTGLLAYECGHQRMEFCVAIHKLNDDTANVTSGLATFLGRQFGSWIPSLQSMFLSYSLNDVGLKRVDRILADAVLADGLSKSTQMLNYRHYLATRLLLNYQLPTALMHPAGSSGVRAAQEHTVPDFCRLRIFYKRTLSTEISVAIVLYDEFHSFLPLPIVRTRLGILMGMDQRSDLPVALPKS